MLTAILSILPVVFVVVAGYVIGIGGWGGNVLRKSLIDFCYYLGIPALLIRTIVSTPVGHAEISSIWLAYLASAAICWIGATVLAASLGGRRVGSASVAMAATYGNVLMLGIPLALAQFGPEASPTIALVVLVHSPVLFAMASLHSAVSAKRSKPSASTVGLVDAVPHSTQSAQTSAVQVMAPARELLVDLATNPVIISIVLALAIRFTGWQLPEVGDKSLGIISQATLPCVLVAVGLGLSSFELKGEMRIILVIAALKVVAMPLLAWYIGTAYLNLPAIDLAVVVFLCAMPVGANAIVFAVRNGNGEASVSGAVAISTLLAPLTISATLAALT